MLKEKYDNCESAFQDQYSLGITDEFIPPFLLTKMER